MNIILFSHDELKLPTLTVEDYRARHIIKIIKAQPGDRLTTGEINGPKGSSRILNIDANSVTFCDITHTDVSPRPQVDLIMALPRPIMLKRVLAQAATFGIDHLFLINSNRVEKSFFSSSKLNPENMHSRLIAGLEQAGATSLPTVSIHKRFRPFIEDELPKHLGNYAHCGLAHPGGRAKIQDIIPLGSQNSRKDNKTLLIIGPEGGWVEYEVEQFTTCGAQRFSMGERILRVDSVVPALLSQLALLQSM